MQSVIHISDLKNAGLLIGMILISLISMLFVLVDINRPSGYGLLFLLPLFFILLLLSTKNIEKEIPQNIGVTLLVFFEFIRMSVSPLLLVLSNYPEKIVLNVSANTPWAVLLMLYEAVAVFFVLNIDFQIKVCVFDRIDNLHSMRRMNYVMFFVIAMTISVITLAPEILSNYRSIVGLFSDLNYTNSEQSYLVDEYATSSSKRFILATANYILIVVRLLIPAFFIAYVNLKKIPLKKIISLFMIITPFLFVAGAIARSLYYSLFLIIFYLTLKKVDLKHLDKPILLAVGFVFAFFMVRFSLAGGGDGSFEMLASSFMSYFSGLNIVSGTFNLPRDFMTQLYYFARDIFGSIPFSTTIFRYDGLSVSHFFNFVNGTRGQIPSTIGLGCYYFSPFFAPVYSMFFAYVAKKYGRMFLAVENQFYKLIYMYLSFIAALGIGMYNIEIALGTMVRVILPIYLIVRFAYRKTGFFTNA